MKPLWLDFFFFFKDMLFQNILRQTSAGKYQHILDWHQLVQRQSVFRGGGGGESVTVVLSCVHIVLTNLVFYRIFVVIEKFLRS